MAIERFEDIESWKLGRVISTQIDEMVKKTGLGSDFPLRDQMSRSAGSIMDNIAEGFDAGSNPEFVRFLWYAKRSGTELQSQLYRAIDRKYCSQENSTSCTPLFAKPKPRSPLSSATSKTTTIPTKPDRPQTPSLELRLFEL